MVNPIKQAIKEELARRSYLDYCKLVQPDWWIIGKHIKYLDKKLTEFLESDNLFLLVSVPPQHGKSEYITATLPSYRAAKYGDRVILGSYGDSLARSFGRANKRKLVEHGHIFDITVDKASDTDIELSNGGKIVSRGVMAGVTGEKGDFIIIDDPIKNREEADSEIHREKLWDEFRDSFYSRMSAKAKMVIIQTRWHEDDLIGRLKQFEGAVEVNLPLEAIEDDPLGREVGDALFPEIGKDKEWVARFKKLYVGEKGLRSWNALYQGMPTSQEGNLFKRAYFKRFISTPEFEKACKLQIISVDAAFKDSKKSDFVSIGVWGKIGSHMYLLYKKKGRMDFVATCNAIEEVCELYPRATGKYIEDKANGSAIISVLSRTIGGIIGITPRESKEARAQAILPFCEAGNVHILEGQDGDELIEEAAAFPLGTNDDDVDMMTQAINILRRRTYATDYYESDDENWLTQRQYNRSKKTSPIIFGVKPQKFG